MKRIVLRVEKHNEIRISSSKVSYKRVQAFLHEQKEWILHRNAHLHTPFAEGTCFYYLSNRYKIKHHETSLKINEDSVYINPAKAKKHSDDFYKARAKEYVSSRLDHWKDIMGLTPSALRFRCAKKQWGSCSSKGVVTFNPYMMKLSHKMIDYIIVHELAHLQHLNHSKKFYALVEAYVPDYVDIEHNINALSSKFMN